MGITQVAVSDPKVVDVQPVSTSEVLVLGVSPGASQLFVWDKFGRHEYDVTSVSADVNIESFAKAAQTAIANKAVTVKAMGGKLALQGTVRTEEERRRAETVAKAVFPNVENFIAVVPSLSEPMLSAVNDVLTKQGVKAVNMPDGKVLISGAVADSAALSALRRALEPWSKEAQFARSDRDHRDAHGRAGGKKDQGYAAA
jgi:Flp pilus assembly secretin CpaC